MTIRKIALCIATVALYLICVYNAVAGQGMGPGPGVKAYAAGGSGAVLIGDSTILVVDQTGASNDANAFVGKEFTAASSGTTAVCKMRMRAANAAAINAKFVITNATGAVLSTSSVVVVSDVYSDVSFSVSQSLVSGTGYKIGVVVENAVNVAYLNTWEGINDGNNYTSPTTVTSVNGDQSIGSMKVWCVN